MVTLTWQFAVSVDVAAAAFGIESPAKPKLPNAKRPTISRDSMPPFLMRRAAKIAKAAAAMATSTITKGRALSEVFAVVAVDVGVDVGYYGSFL